VTMQQFVRAGDRWKERSTTAGPECLPCPNCGAEWHPVFVAFQRSHPLDCAYVADIMKSSEVTAILEQYAASLPSPEDALPDEELEGYVLGVRDALKILRGESPEKMGRSTLD
jgi:hypothetical protein